MDIPTSPHQRLAQLLHRVSLRDDAAFRQLYDLTSAHLYGIALRFVRRHEAADEILQEAFINVWQQAGTYSASLSAPMTWLISIVRNKALDSLRRGKVEGKSIVPAGDDDVDARADADAAEAGDDPHDLFSAAIEKLRLERCLSDLDAPQRQSLALVYYTGLSHSELSDHLQVPLGTAKAWVRRGLDRLRLCLEHVQDRSMSKGVS